MDEKKLLELYEKLKQDHGLTRTYDEFSISMGDENYRSKIFNFVKSKSTSEEQANRDLVNYFGDTNYERWNYQNFGELEKTEVTLDDPVKVTDSNLLTIQGNKTSPLPERRISKRGTPGTRSRGRNIGAYTQSIIDENKKKQKEKEEQEVFNETIRRAQTSAGGITTAIEDNADILTIGKIYAQKTDNNDLLTKIEASADFPDIRKANLELDIINRVYEDYSALYGRLDQNERFRKNVKEFEFLRGELENRKKKISALQERAKTLKTQEEVDAHNEELRLLLEEDASWEVPDELKGSKVLKYGSYQELAERYNFLLGSADFREYDAILKVANYMQDQSESFESRHPAWVENQQDVRNTQQTADLMSQMKILPGVSAMDNIGKPIARTLLKGARDLLTLPRTITGLFDNDYGVLDKLADWSEENLNPENYVLTTSPSDITRGFAEQVAIVDGHQVVVDENDNSKVLNVRNEKGFLVFDEKKQKEISDKYTDLYKKQEVEVSTQRNPEVLLNKTIGVIGDLAVLVVGTKGVGGLARGSGKLLSKTGRVGNYLTKSLDANRIGLTGAIFGQSHNDFYNEAIQQGMSQKEASAFASSASLMIAGIGQFNPQFFLLGSSRPLQKKFTKKYASLILNDKLPPKVALKNTVKFLGLQGGKETIEELAEIPGVNLVRGVFNTQVTPDKAFEINWSQNEMEETALLGFAGGFFGGMGNTNVSRLQKEALYRAYNDRSNFKNRFQDMIGMEYPNEDGEMKVITKEFVDERTQYFEKAFAQIDAMNQGKKVDDHIVLEMLGLQWKKQSLEQMSETFGIQSVQEELAKVNDQLLEMSAKNTILEEVVNDEIKPNKPVTEEVVEDEVISDEEVSTAESIFPLEESEKPDVQPQPQEDTPLAESDYFADMKSKLETANPDIEVVVDKELAEELARTKTDQQTARRVKGVYEDGKRIVINPETFDKATLFHEFGHHWNRKVKKDRPELWSTGVNLIKDTEIYNEAKSTVESTRKPEDVNEERIIDEALAIAIGRKGSEIFENQEQQTAWDKWVDQVKQFMADIFGLDLKNKTLDELTLEDFTSIAAQEIATGQEVDVLGSVKMDLKNKSIKVGRTKDGTIVFINKETGNPVSPSTLRKYEKEYINQTEFDALQVSLAKELKEELGQNLDDKFDPAVINFVGAYRIKRSSFEEFNDPNSITGGLARGWFSKDGRTLDEVAQELESIIYGDTKLGQIDPEYLSDIMLEYPSNRLPVKSDRAKELESEFTDATGLRPTKSNVESIINKSKAETEQNIEPDENVELPFDIEFDLPSNLSLGKIYDGVQNLKQSGKLTRSKIIKYISDRFGIPVAEVRKMYEGQRPVENAKPKERTYYARLKESLRNDTKKSVSEEGKKYVPKSNIITESEADAIISEMGAVDVMHLINENPLWLQPEVRVTLLNKVVQSTEQEIERLNGEGLTEQAKDLELALADAIGKVAQEGTRAGRFIQAFSLLDKLNPERFVRQVENQIRNNKKFKENSKLTPEEARKIKELKKKVNEAPDGLPKANANYELYSYVDEVKYKKGEPLTKFEDIFKAFFYSSILSGITTPIRNVTANMMSIMSELYISALSDPKTMYQSFRGMLKGFGKGMLNARNVFKTGVKSQIGDKFDTPTTLEWFRWTNNNIIGKVLNTKLAGLVPGIAIAPNFYKYINRIMVAGDVLFYHAGKDMRAYALAQRSKKGDKVTPQDLEKADNILYPSQDYISTAKAQAKQEGFEEGSLQYKVRVHEILDQRRDEKIVEDSQDFASRVTFNYEPEGSLKVLYDVVVDLRNRTGIGSVMTTFIPFARVLTNVLNRFIDWTPVGAVRAMRKGSAFGLGDYAGQKDFRALTPEQKSHLFIKSASGMMATMGLYALTQMGDDDEEKLVITGGGPKDYKKRYQLENAGWRPYTIKYGDKSISYIDNPLFFMISAVGEINDYGKYETPSEDYMQRLRDISFGIGNSIFEQSWLQGFDELGKTLSQPLFGLGEKFEKTFAGMQISNLHRQMIKTYQETQGIPITDVPTGKYGFMNRVLRDNPWFNGIVFGNGSYDAIYNEQGIPVIPSQIEKFVPFKLDFDGRESDPVTKLLTDNGIFLSYPSNRNVYDMESGKSRRMTDKEYNEYKKITGKILGRNLKEYYSDMKQMQPMDLQEFYRGIKRASNDEAYGIFLDSFYN